MTQGKLKKAKVDTNSIDPKQTHQVAEYKHEVALTTLRVDPTGRFVAAGAEDLDVQLWDLKSGRAANSQGT